MKKLIGMMSLGFIIQYSNFAFSDTTKVGKSFIGQYQLSSGSQECLTSIQISYEEDGNPYYCASIEAGPRLVIQSTDGANLRHIIGCIDQPAHGAMDTYACNFTWDAKTSEAIGKKGVLITTRNGRKCIFKPTSWHIISRYSLSNNNSNLNITINNLKENTNISCNYIKALSLR